MTEAPKKSKKKFKDYDKKAEQLAASSDFDAYIDRAVSINDFNPYDFVPYLGQYCTFCMHAGNFS